MRICMRARKTSKEKSMQTGSVKTHLRGILTYFQTDRYQGRARVAQAEVSAARRSPVAVPVLSSGR